MKFYGEKNLVSLCFFYLLSTLDVMNLFDKTIFDICLDFDFGLIVGESGSSENL